MDNKVYTSFISDIVVPNLKKEFGNDFASKLVWQDDGDSKHRTKHVQQTIEKYFAQRIPIKQQAAKMADIWPIENVWGILREKLSGNDCENVVKLKKQIMKKWQSFTPELCHKLMSSIGRRLKAVIKKNGEQVVKKDYQ